MHLHNYHTKQQHFENRFSNSRSLNNLGISTVLSESILGLRDTILARLMQTTEKSFSTLKKKKIRQFSFKTALCLFAAELRRYAYHLVVS